MKCHLVLSIVLSALCLASSINAAEDPRAYARRQQAAEEQKRVSARLLVLEETLQAYQKEIHALRAEVRTLKLQLNQTSQGAGDVSELVEKIKEVDRKRMADNKKILETLNKLQKSAGPPRTPARTTRDDYEYEIRQGDTLYDIVTGLSAEGFKVTQDQVMKANPTVKWNRLQIGQKIVIPAPKR